MTTASIILACELCRDAVVAGSAHTVSFNASIYWMLGGLFAVMTMVGRLMYKTVNEAEATSPDKPHQR
jgi:hypothetical protein